MLPLAVDIQTRAAPCRRVAAGPTNLAELPTCAGILLAPVSRTGLRWYHRYYITYHSSIADLLTAFILSFNYFDSRDRF